MLTAATVAYWRALAATSRWERAKTIGAVTVVTSAAVSGSRYSGGAGVGKVQPASPTVRPARSVRHKLFRLLRMSEVHPVADADEQAGGVADLQDLRIAADFGAGLDLDHPAVALPVRVGVGIVEVLHRSGVIHDPLRQDPWPDAPCAPERIPGDVVHSARVCRGGMVVAQDELVKI